MRVRAKAVRRRTAKQAHRFEDKLKLLKIVWLTPNSIEILRPKYKCLPLSAALPCPQCEELVHAVRRSLGKREEATYIWNYQAARFNGCSTCRKLTTHLYSQSIIQKRSDLSGMIQHLVHDDCLVLDGMVTWR
jgi:hypothetical protein